MITLFRLSALVLAIAWTTVATLAAPPVEAAGPVGRPVPAFIPAPASPQVSFSAQPSDEEITRARIFSEPLVPMNVDRDAAVTLAEPDARPRVSRVPEGPPGRRTVGEHGRPQRI